MILEQSIWLDKFSHLIACHSKLWSWISSISLHTSPTDWAYQWGKLILCQWNQTCFWHVFLTCPETPQYILGDTCACATEAQQNVAKKAITQLQSDNKFTVRDVSFVPMIRA